MNVVLVSLTKFVIIVINEDTGGETIMLLNLGLSRLVLVLTPSQQCLLSLSRCLSLHVVS